MIMRRLNIGSKMFLGFGIVILIMLTVIGNRYIKCIKESDGLLMSLTNMEMEARGDVITGNESFIEPFNQGNPSYENHYNKLINNRKKVSSGQLKLEDLIIIVQSDYRKTTMDNLRLALGNINCEKEKILQSRNVNLVKIEKETRTIILIGGAFATIVAIVIAILVIRMIIQQKELRVSNEELEEKTRILEKQKEDIIKNNELLSKANHEIEEKAKELELANKYKSEFLANISHELKTPLNSILVLSQLLENKKDDQPLTDKQLEYAKIIHSSGKNLLKLINDILDLSKVEAGKMDINFERIDLVELINDTRKLFNPIALEKNIDFKLKIEEGLPKKIISDRQRLQQIINNLLSNAFKFTKNGYVKMNIRRPKKCDVEYFNFKDDANKLVSIEVIDTGIGIPIDKQKLIFEAFKQVDGTISRKYGGTGLGLSISKELANLLGGVIYLKSKEGNGSTFTLVISDNNSYDIELVK